MSWKSSTVSALDSSFLPKRPYEWRVDSHGCYKFDIAALGFGPRDQSAHLPVFLHLRTIKVMWVPYFSHPLRLPVSHSLVSCVYPPH